MVRPCGAISAPLTKPTNNQMKLIKVLALALAAAGVMLSASCCNKAPATTAPIYIPPTK